MIAVPAFCVKTKLGTYFAKSFTALRPCPRNSCSSTTLIAIGIFWRFWAPVLVAVTTISVSPPDWSSTEVVCGEAAVPCAHVGDPMAHAQALDANNAIA